MKGVNKVILVGTIGKDPEIKHMNNGNNVTSFSLATSEQWKDQQGNKQEKTEWHNISAFGKLADIASQYLTKGSRVYIEGKIRTNKWQDKEGNNREQKNIIANELQMLDRKQQGQQQNNQDNYQNQQNNQQGQQNNQYSQNSKQGQQAYNQTMEQPFDDDIPF